jgi:hypothetical protein
MLTYGKKSEYDLVAAFSRAYGQVRRYGEYHKHFAAGIQEADGEKINEEHNLNDGGRAYQILRRHAIDFYLWAGESLVKVRSPRYSTPTATLERGTVEDFKNACAAIDSIVALKKKALADELYAKQLSAIPVCARRK